MGWRHAPSSAVAPVRAAAFAPAPVSPPHPPPSRRSSTRPFCACRAPTCRAAAPPGASRLLVRCRLLRCCGRLCDGALWCLVANSSPRIHAAQGRSRSRAARAQNFSGLAGTHFTDPVGSGGKSRQIGTGACPRLLGNLKLGSRKNEPGDSEKSYEKAPKRKD